MENVLRDAHAADMPRVMPTMLATAKSTVGHWGQFSKHLSFLCDRTAIFSGLESAQRTGTLFSWFEHNSGRCELSAVLLLCTVSARIHSHDAVQITDTPW